MSRTVKHVSTPLRHAHIIDLAAFRFGCFTPGKGLRYPGDSRLNCAQIRDSKLGSSGLSEDSAASVLLVLAVSASFVRGCA